MMLKVVLFLLSQFSSEPLPLPSQNMVLCSLVLEGIVPHYWIGQGYNQNLVSSRNSKSVTAGYMWRTRHWLFKFRPLIKLWKVLQKCQVYLNLRKLQLYHVSQEEQNQIDTGCCWIFYPIRDQGIILDKMKILTLLVPSEFLEYLEKA